MASDATMVLVAFSKLSAALRCPVPGFSCISTASIWRQRVVVLTFLGGSGMCGWLCLAGRIDGALGTPWRGCETWGITREFTDPTGGSAAVQPESSPHLPTHSPHGTMRRKTHRTRMHGPACATLRMWPAKATMGQLMECAATGRLPRSFW